MADESNKHAPKKIPEKLLRAFKEEGIDLEFLICADSKGKETIFSKYDPPYSHPEPFEMDKLAKPHLDIAVYRDGKAVSASSSGNWCRVWGPWGCFWVPC